jgi:L-glyceraldehyde 3-phosphate reductase
VEFNPNRYDHMQYRHCGKWGLKLPLISLGGWQTVGGYEAEAEAKKCFFSAFDAGITHFDFANNYGTPPGNGEITGGKILRELPRDEIIISSKAGYHMWEGPYGEWGSRKNIIASCDQSLKRMGLDYFDIFYHHRPDPNTPLEETHSALETLVQQGKALYAGISNYSPQMAEDTVLLRERKNWFPITIHQPKYNMFTRNIEDGLIDCAAKHGFGLIPFSPLAQGLLSDRYLDGIPADSRYAAKGKNKALNESQVKKVQALNAAARERGQSLAQMALAWILRWPQITSVLTAVSNVGQLNDSLKALENLQFSDEELKRIDEILAAV